MSAELGRVYTKDDSYRGRAEKRQRQYRSRNLELKPGRYGHLLTEHDAENGANFVIPEAFDAARARRDAGKGVARRTFNNMLSSQAMCFNLFAPLANDTRLATRVLGRVLPLREVSEIIIEHTPDKEIFNDQKGIAGVDCDVLIVGNDASGRSIVMTLETKFVETEFSICGFRKSNRKNRESCPSDIQLANDTSRCLYKSRRGYRYWQRTNEHHLLVPDAVASIGCPFGGQLWQLWVNRTLAAAECTLRGAEKSAFVLCAPAANRELLGSGILEEFRRLLAEPESVHFIDTEDLIEAIEQESTDRPEWAPRLRVRYSVK